MANILLADPDPIARAAMSGFLAMGNHRCAAVSSCEDALKFIAQNLKIDLIITELKLSTSPGLELLRRLKSDFVMRDIPVLVYANKGDREDVRQAFTFNVLNVLYKPYDEEALFQEIEKVLHRPWYEEGFEEVDLDDHPENKTQSDVQRELNQKLEAFSSRVAKIRAQLATRIEPFNEETRLDEIKVLIEELGRYKKEAEAAGAYRIHDCLEQLITKARSKSWSDFKYSLEYLDWGGRLIYFHLHPDALPEGFLGDEDPDAILENRNRMFWAGALRQGNFPVLSARDLQRELKMLSGCPVARTSAAAFQMSATGSVASLHPLMDLAEGDPGLCLQVLISANQLKKSKTEGAFTFLEDPRLAIGFLGEVRLTSIARSLLRANEKWMDALPETRWREFLKFQKATAAIARFACDQMELSNLGPVAFLGGIVHDIGKLLLLRLHPAGFQAVLKHASEKGLSVTDSERLLLGTTTREMAAAFVGDLLIPPRFINVVRFWNNPEAAPADLELVAVVSLAHHLCEENRVGFGGDFPPKNPIPLDKTPAWRILSTRVFPSFSLSKFQALAKAKCAEF